jgi:hypothetical protein
VKRGGVRYPSNGQEFILVLLFILQFSFLLQTVLWFLPRLFFAFIPFSTFTHGCFSFHANKFFRNVPDIVKLDSEGNSAASASEGDAPFPDYCQLSPVFAVRAGIGSQRDHNQDSRKFKRLYYIAFFRFTPEVRFLENLNFLLTLTLRQGLYYVRGKCVYC